VSCRGGDLACRGRLAHPVLQAEPQRGIAAWSCRWPPQQILSSAHTVEAPHLARSDVPLRGTAQSVRGSRQVAAVQFQLMDSSNSTIWILQIARPQFGS